MPDAQWIENMKRIMLQAVEAGDPCDFIPGTVVSVCLLYTSSGK